MTMELFSGMLTAMRPAVLAVMFVLGACAGSFCGVIAWRLPRGLSIVRPSRSFCGSCGHMIRWYDDIPILSWLILRGRCRDCGARIPFFYPFMELLYASEALALTWLAYAGPLPVRFLPAVLFAAFATTTMAVMDQRTHLVEFSLMDITVVGTIALLITGTLAAGVARREPLWTWGEWMPVGRAVAGGLIVSGFYLLASLYFRHVRHVDGVGGADIEIGLVVGMVLGVVGWRSLVIGFFSIFLIEGLFLVGYVGFSRIVHRDTSGVLFHADEDAAADDDDKTNASVIPPDSESTPQTHIKAPVGVVGADGGDDTDTPPTGADGTSTTPMAVDGGDDAPPVGSSADERLGRLVRAVPQTDDPDADAATITTDALPDDGATPTSPEPDSQSDGDDDGVLGMAVAHVPFMVAGMLFGALFGGPFVSLYLSLTVGSLSAVAGLIG